MNCAKIDAYLSGIHPTWWSVTWFAGKSWKIQKFIEYLSPRHTHFQKGNFPAFATFFWIPGQTMKLGPIFGCL